MNITSGLTELEARLAGPDGASLHTELGKQLRTIERRLRERILDGLSREDYLDSQAAIQAVQAAYDVLTDYSDTHLSSPGTLSPPPLSPQFPR